MPIFVPPPHHINKVEPPAVPSLDVSSNVPAVSTPFVFTNEEIKSALASVNYIKNLKPVANEDDSVFNGHDIGQPKRISVNDQIEVDFYSNRPECRVQRLMIEAAERTIDNGEISERFRIFSGIPEGVPDNVFAGRAGHDPVFYLVDTQALDFGHPPCLVLCWVDRTKQVFQAVPFSHPRDYGELVLERVMQEVQAT